MKSRRDERNHIFDYLSDLPLRSVAKALVADMDKFSQIAREIEVCATSIGENISNIFLVYTS
jgi:hypothetical protein